MFFYGAYGNPSQNCTFPQLNSPVSAPLRRFDAGHETSTSDHPRIALKSPLMECIQDTPRRALGATGQAVKEGAGSPASHSY